MAKSRRTSVDTSGDTEPPTDTENVPESEPKDNRSVPSARAPRSPAKKPAAVEYAQEPIDRSPQVTITQFARGTQDPILRAFGAHEKLTQEVRKLTHAQWKAEFAAFKKVGR